MTKYYALLDTDEIVFVGEFDDIHGAFDAVDKLPNSAVWVMNEDSARTWLDQLQGLLK